MRVRLVDTHPERHRWPWVAWCETCCAPIEEGDIYYRALAAYGHLSYQAGVCSICADDPKLGNQIVTVVRLRGTKELPMGLNPNRDFIRNRAYPRGDKFKPDDIDERLALLQPLVVPHYMYHLNAAYMTAANKSRIKQIIRLTGSATFIGDNITQANVEFMLQCCVEVKAENPSLNPGIAPIIKPFTTRTFNFSSIPPTDVSHDAVELAFYDTTFNNIESWRAAWNGGSVPMKAVITECETWNVSGGGGWEAAMTVKFDAIYDRIKAKWPGLRQEIYNTTSGGIFPFGAKHDTSSVPDYYSTQIDKLNSRWVGAIADMILAGKTILNPWISIAYQYDPHYPTAHVSTDEFGKYYPAYPSRYSRRWGRLLNNAVQPDPLGFRTYLDSVILYPQVSDPAVASDLWWEHFTEYCLGAQEYA